MLNLLEDYIFRSVPEEDFTTNPNLSGKVDGAGEFRPYFGNTVVFPLDAGTRNALRSLQAALYEAAGEMLARPLEDATFHMTLHDLVHGPALTGELQRQMAETEARVRPLLSQWQDLPPLRMRSTALFNLVHTSVVLGLAPADEMSWQQLDSMYTALETVVPLGYGLTPHVTMAYYKPGTYPKETLDGLRNVLGAVELETTLPMDTLVYQTFTDMNHYTAG